MAPLAAAGCRGNRLLTVSCVVLLDRPVEGNIVEKQSADTVKTVKLHLPALDEVDGLFQAFENDVYLFLGQLDKKLSTLHFAALGEVLTVLARFTQVSRFISLLPSASAR